MARIYPGRRFFVSVLVFLLLFGGTGFFLHSLFAERYVQSASNVIGTGKSQLFQRSISGVLGAYQTFQGASLNDYATASDAEKIKIRVYLALTRMFDTLLRKDGGSIDTLAELFEQYGVEMQGDSFDTLHFTPPPLNDDGKLILPSTAPPSAETLQSFFAGPFLTSVNASISDMDAAIALCPETEGIDKEIISRELIAPGDTYQPDVEMDAGDYYLFRAFLKFLKFYVLGYAGYNTGIDIREIVSLVNRGVGQEAIKVLLDRYPYFLKISNAGRLNEARLALLEAIADYETASAKIRGDFSTQAGAEEMVSLDLADRQKEAFLREQMALVKDSLQNNKAVALGGSDEYWRFTVSDPSGAQDISITFSDSFSDGHYSYYGPLTDKFGYYGQMEYAIINGNDVTLHFSSSWPSYGWVEFHGTFNADKTQISSGTYSGWNSSTWNYSGTFTASRIDFVSHKKNFNFYPLLGNGTTTPPAALRDMLPGINAYGYAEPGTMGKGLGKDPTLGGFLPDFTQDIWITETDGDNIFLPSGPLTIPQVSDTAIRIDGSTTDWTGIAVAMHDVTGERGPYMAANGDLKELYLARDNTYLYVRMDMNGDIAGGLPVTYGLRFRQSPGDAPDKPGDIKVFAQSIGGTWSVSKQSVQTYGWYGPTEDLGASNGFAASAGNSVEFRVPLGSLTLSGRFLAVDIDQQDYWLGGYDTNYTCLQIQPAANATVSGTLNVPGYDGTGPVYVTVSNYSTGSRIGYQVIYPDTSGNLPDYEITNLPVGDKVYLSVLWDRDQNGVTTPGDYTGSSLPFTTTEGENPQNITLDGNWLVYPAPRFNLTRIYHEKTTAGYWDTLMVASVSGPGPWDVAVTVTGPGGEYRLSPVTWIANRFGLVYSMQTYYSLPDGDYTFTAVDSLGRTVQAIVHYKGRWDLPSFTALFPADRTYTGTVTPTLSWTPPAGGPYTYQVFIADYNSSSGVYWYVSDMTQATSLTVPAGVLLPNTSYQWYVRLYDSDSQPMNFVQSPVYSFYTGIHAASPEYQRVRIVTRPPAGTNTMYQSWVDIELPGVAPWDIQAWRLKQGGILVASGYVPAVVNRAETAFLEAGLPPTTIPPAKANDYRFEIDMLLPNGTQATIVSPDTAFQFTPVDAPSYTSLTPADPYVKTTAPTFSWEAVSNPDTWYTLQIYALSRTLQRVYTSRFSQSTSATVPVGILKAGGTYAWTVMAMTTPTPLTTSGGFTVSPVNVEGSNRSRLFTILPAPVADVSGNGETGLEDLVLVLQIVTGQRPAIASFGDVNADGRTGLPEALYILQELSGMRP